MKQIKDLVTLRAFAIEQAVRYGATSKVTLRMAKEFVAYILGNAELPELFDDSFQTECNNFPKDEIEKPSQTQ